MPDVFSMIKNNTYVNLAYIFATLLFSIILIVTTIRTYLSKKFNKTHVSEMTTLIRERKGEQ